MKIFNFKLTALIAIAAVGLSSLPANAAGINPDSNPRVAKMRQTVKPVRPFRGQKPWDVQTAWQKADLNAKLSNKGEVRKMAVDNPSVEFAGLSTYDYLEAPDGTTWFYTSEYDIESVEVSEWYSEEHIVGYTFTIYDSSFKEVGKIKDKITLAEGESKVAHAVLDPNISAKFFNADDKYEVMVYLAMNTSAEFDYKVHYYNKVYSIGGEKDSEGNDVSLQTIQGRCVDVFNAAEGQGENCFYTFVDDVEPDMDDYKEMVDWINAHYTHVMVYSKTTGEAAPACVYEKDIYQTRIPGDTTDGIYLITKSVNGTPYFIFSQYDKPYFVDPTGFASDESATEDNSLVIEVYSYTNGMNPVSTTKIPVEIKHVAGEINYTFYSIGSVAWKDDVDMSVNGTPQAPAFLVSRDVTKASNLEEVASSYDIYGTDGQLKRTLAENTDNIILMGNVKGAEPQALFINQSGNGDYTFNFVNLYSGNTVLSLPRIFDGNADNALSASCQRVTDELGSYQYVFEMQYDDMDEEGNDIKRMAWINPDGTLERIDRVNMGKDVQAASVNMYVACLSPTLFDTDEAMEYAVLVKRTSGNTTKNEFIIVDDNGKWYAQFSEADGKGAPMTFQIFPGADKNRLQMVYLTDDYNVNMDIYDLPFMNESVGTAVESVQTDLGGAAVYYDLGGRRVSNPKAGIYVKKQGHSVQKVVVN